MTTKHADYDQPLSLMQATGLLLEGADLIKVSAETSISFYWLKKFATGQFRNPSVNRVQYLYEHLTKNPLL